MLLFFLFVFTAKRLSLSQLKLQRRGGTGSCVMGLRAPTGGGPEDEAPHNKGAPNDEASPKTGAPNGLSGSASGTERGGAERKRKETEEEGRGDSLCSVQWVEEEKQQVVLVSKQGFLVRQSVAKMPLYLSRTARGVLTQKLLKGPDGDRDTLVAAAVFRDSQEAPEQKETGDTQQKKPSPSTPQGPPPTDAGAGGAFSTTGDKQKKRQKEADM